MRREGRQRGMVRTFVVLRSANELSAPPTAGLFTKAPSKPTNHSKFTGKCGRPNCRDCHIEPACKSKDKAKGTHKTRTTPSDVGLITWSAVGAAGRVQVSGYSATGVLDYLDDGEGDDCYVDDDNDDYRGGGADERYEDNILSLPPRFVGMDDDDDKLSFCDVGLACGSMDGDDDGWCLVEDNL
ncbi:hypothetical protein PHJA_001552600 [Phtheirospermum japonicum]|uniref:Uncharacterized protein n=1 Tax=Phtheirospermum japonicum TaxID=374723 RepID=A0A830C7D6_9LAMI|nr:hypothetical protein PHJA_001552600 [Phtheirospermum japonicum]